MMAQNSPSAMVKVMPLSTCKSIMPVWYVLVMSRNSIVILSPNARGPVIGRQSGIPAV